MRKRKVVFAPEARRDLADIEERLLAVTSSRTTEGFIARIFDACDALETASERGHERSDIRDGMRIVGFERRLTIAFAVHDDRVEILRLFRAGRDWEGAFGKE